MVFLLLFWAESCEPAQNDATETCEITYPLTQRSDQLLIPHPPPAFGNTKMRVLPALVAASAAASALAFQPAATERPTTALSESAAADRRSVLKTAASAISTAALLSVATTPEPASARLEAVNRPDLLPAESGKNVIQVSMVGIGSDAFASMAIFV